MDTKKINELLENVRRDSGGAFLTGLAYIGDRLGLFQALAENGPLDSPRLAELSGTQERYVREWLKALTAFGYVEHDPDAATWWLTAEQAAVLAADGVRERGGDVLEHGCEEGVLVDHVLIKEPQRRGDGGDRRRHHVAGDP